MPICKVEAKIAIGPVVVWGRVGEEVRAGYREELNGKLKRVLEVVTPATVREAQFRNGELVSGSAKSWTGSEINRSPLRDKFRFFNLLNGESNESSKRKLILLGHVF